jgi:2-polyprenyl-6-methoxyphenol hydroxylase-like FAD-dependent oxidoreductase
MTLEDAMVIAKCISNETSIADAFARYETLRRPRTSHIQRRSRLMGQIGQWQNRCMVEARGIVSEMLPSALFERNLRRTYSYEA